MEDTDGDDDDVLLTAGPAAAAAAAAGLSHDDSDTSPLDLTTATRSETSPSSSSSSSSSRDVTPAQILVLAGQRYEILPVGGGRWVCRRDYDRLISTAYRSSDDRQLTDDDNDDELSIDNSVAPTPASAGETPRVDDVDSKARLDGVSTETRDVSTL